MSLSFSMRSTPTQPASSGVDVTAPASQHDQLFEKWCSWLEEITTHVLNLFHNRNIWREMSQALHDYEAGVFLAHYADLYVAGQSLAVRRIADDRAGGPTLSLGRLLGDLGRNPAVMSRDRYVARHAAGGDEFGYWTRHAQATFDAKFGNADGLLCVVKNGDRSERVSSASKSISDFADRYVAHVDSRGLDDLPTFEDLDRAIDEVGELLQDVTLLLTARSLMNTEPTIQENWRRPFRSAIF